MRFIIRKRRHVQTSGILTLGPVEFFSGNGHGNVVKPIRSSSLRSGPGGIRADLRCVHVEMPKKTRRRSMDFFTGFPMCDSGIVGGIQKTINYRSAGAQDRSARLRHAHVRGEREGTGSEFRDGD